MTSLSDSTSVLMNIRKEIAATFPSKAAYESAQVVDAAHMNKTDVNGYPQDRTPQYMFPPVCIKYHWDPESYSKHVLPADLKIPLPVDPRPLVRICTQYMTSAPVDPDEKTNAAKRAAAAAALMLQPGGAASRGLPYENYITNVNVESEIYMNHPQDKCNDNKWVAAADSDLYTNRHAPPRNTDIGSFPELSRPIATIVPNGPHKCRADADDVAWNRSARLFNNPTREDRAPGAAARSSEALLSKKRTATAKVSATPRVWPNNSVVFYVGTGDGGDTLTNLALGLRARDYEVTIYAPLRTSAHEGLSYHSLAEYVPNDIYSTVIMWGDSDLLANFQYRPTCKVLLLNIEDNLESEQVCHRTVKESVDRIVVKSAYHRSLYNCYPWSKFEIVPNGLPVALFTDVENRSLPREKYRVLVTEYSEALVRFVNTAWLRIIATYPGAELHVWESAGDQKKRVMPALVGTAKGKGLVLHDRGSLNELVRERFRSNVHVYLEDYDQVSCDTVRMSILAGCIPIMPDRGVYSELRGINVPGSVMDETVLVEYAKSVSAIFRDPSRYDVMRRRNQTDEGLKGWNGTTDRWLTIIKGLATSAKPFSAGVYNSLFN